MSGVERHRVREDEAGMRLDRWFRVRFPQLGHGALQKALRKGQVRVDGKRIRAAHRLLSGQEIRVPPLPERQGERPAPRTSPSDRQMMQAMVVHRDRAILVLNKLPGLAVQGGSGVHRHIDGLLEALRFEYDENPRLVHRLDKDTSGILVLARTRKVAAALGRLFQGRQVRKTYWALLSRVPAPDRGQIDLPLVKTGRDGHERMHAGTTGEGARPALTRYGLIARAGNRAAWVAMRPVTGRTHQLRAHAAAIGCPIVGDGKYGGAAAMIGGLSGKLHLHARAIAFPHPHGGSFTIEAEMPSHMQRSWAMLGLDETEPHDPFEDET